MSAAARAFRDLVGSRRSVRRFGPGAPSEAALRAVLEAAGRAPSAHNRQPWRFAVVRSAEARARLADEMAARFRRDLTADGLEPPEVEARAGRSRARLTGAPVVLVLCLTMQGMDEYPDARRRQAEHTMAVQGAALAGGHALLAAHAHGLGACWMCAPLFAPEEVRRALGLPDDWEPQALLLLGEPAEPGRERQRLPLEATVRWL